MFDSRNNTPEGFMLPEDTLRFDGQSNMLRNLDHVDITDYDAHFLSPSMSLELQNHEVTQTLYSGSGSVSGPDPGPGAASGSSSGTAASTTVSVRRNKPIPRKGHTKSRRGCYTCKRRKVKCSETLPECDNCVRIGLICEYPEPPNPSALSRLVNSGQRRAQQKQTDAQILQPPDLTIISSPSSTPMFTLQDLRFFHHFLTAAHPPLPAQADGLWNNVAALSHNYPYLVHAMLGLAASHLSLLTSSSPSFLSQSSQSQAQESAIALGHRIKAISLLNHSLSHPCSSPAEGDARFATILILAFQASCLPDGMTEFLSMIRLCSAIADCGENSIFSELANRGYSDSMRKMTAKTKAEVERKGLGREQERSVDEFIKSLGRLRVGIMGVGVKNEKDTENGGLVKGHEGGRRLQLLVLEGMEGAARTSKVSPAQAFQDLTNIYSPMINAPSADFASLTDPANHYAQILLLHFFFMEFALGDLSLGSFRPRFAFRRKVCFAWLNEVARQLPKTTEYAELMEWPLELGKIVFTPREPT